MMVCSLSLLDMVTLQKTLHKEKPAGEAIRNTGICRLKIKTLASWKDKQLSKKCREVNLTASQLNNQESVLVHFLALK